jgi:hypothetical protein
VSSLFGFGPVDPHGCGQLRRPRPSPRETPGVLDELRHVGAGEIDFGLHARPAAHEEAELLLLARPDTRRLATHVDEALTGPHGVEADTLLALDEMGPLNGPIAGRCSTCVGEVS